MHLKILQIRSLLERFSENLITHDKSCTANGRSIFPLRESFLILKIGRREPFSFPVEYFKRCLQFLVSISGFFVGNLNGFKFCMGTQ